MLKDLENKLVELIAPEVISKNFEVSSIKENSNTITIVFEEKSTLVPKELKGKEVVLDGFLNSVDIQTFSLKDKMVYLRIKRRRWKEQGKSLSFSNTYHLHRKGMKTTDEFGNFLKEELRFSPTEYNKLWDSPSSKG